MSQTKKGIILSYLNLLMGMVVNIFLTPLMIITLGDVDYSLYKVMYSLAGPLTMFHLGISTIVTRAIVKNKDNSDQSKLERQNVLATSIIASIMMSVIVVIVGIIMLNSIPAIYGSNYSAESIKLGQQIFFIFLISSILHMLTDAFSGCILGNERYVVSSVIPLLKTVFKCLLLGILLIFGCDVIFVSIVDLILAIFVFFITVLYSVFVLHEIPKLHYFDKKQFCEIFSYGAAIILQTFVNQVNNNMDTMLLGAFVQDKAVITMYSSALAIYAIYNSLISVVTHYFLPQATRLTIKSASGRELTDFVIKPGRLQASVAVACICGFALFGRNFISIWIGQQYMNAYWVILMLMVPVTIPLVENATISILDATMKRMYRSVVLAVMAILNLIASIILIRLMGFWGAALGTMLSLLIGHGLLMNIYYAKVFHIEVFRLFRQIFKGILFAGLLATIVCLPLAIFLPNTLVWFIIKCASFVLIYTLFLFLFGFNKEEKSMFDKVLKKFNINKLKG